MIPEGWKKYRIEDICDVVGGGTPERSRSDFWNGCIPWVSPTEVTSLSGRYIEKTKEYISDEGLARSSAKLLPVGTVLMTSRASIGYPAINSVPMTTNQGFQSLKCREKVYNEYLYQLILFVRPELEKMSAGSTFQEISSTNVKAIKLLLPPLPEQKKIASILTSVDEVIEKQEAQISKLQDLKKAMMQELLTKGIGHTEFKDSPVGMIPKGWEVVRLGKYVKLQGGYAFKSENFTDKGVPVVRISNISKSGDVDLSNAAFHDEINISEAFEVSHSDSLIAMSGATTGKVGRYNFREKAYLNQRVGKFVSKGMVEMSYIHHVVSSSSFTEKLLIDAIGGAQPNISGGQIEGVEIAFPPLDEQKNISSILDSIDNAVGAKQLKLMHIKSLKKSLMQDLLTGKVRVMV
ncbi:restriction endonuclease subunit S [Mariprofundus ferrooxydans]|nr:restriction endonuclease subunit S [Mariprofundus ferrooxydans]